MAFESRHGHRLAIRVYGYSKVLNDYLGGIGLVTVVCLHGQLWVAGEVDKTLWVGREATCNKGRCTQFSHLDESGKFHKVCRIEKRQNFKKCHFYL